MSRAQEIVEKIRRCLRHYDGKAAAEGQQIARDYAEVVDQVNQRLETCVGLLRKGLRTEAMHLAELSPNLFDEAIALDFPEWQDWAYLCEQAGYGAAARVNDQAVVELDEALPAEQELADLLNRHRLLALARAPLRSRIHVLQRLSQEDIGSPMWGEDLVAFEKERHKQIHEEAHRAEKKGDLEKIESLKKEVNGGWANKPPDSLTKRVSDAWARVKAKQAAAELADLQHATERALADADPGALEPALKRLQKAAGHLERPDPAANDLIARASSWLADYKADEQAQADFQSAVRALEHALDNEADIQSLDRHWAAVSSYDRAVPDAMIRRYEARLRQSQMDSKRKFRLKLVAVVGVLLIVGAVVAVLVMQVAQQRQLDRWSSQLESLVADEKWPEADNMLAGLQQDHPDIYATPEILEFAKQVSSAIETESIRTSEFQDIDAQIEQGLSFAEESNTPYSNTDLMEELEGLAKTPNEKRRVSGLGRRIDALQASLQAEIDKQAMESLGLLRERFNEVQNHLQEESKGLSMLLEDAKAIEAELLSLQKDQAISDNAAGALTVLQVGVKSVRQTLENNVEGELTRARMIREIKRKFAEPSALAKLYQEFVVAFPEDEFAEDFSACAKMQDPWNAIIAWSEATEGSAELRPTSVYHANDRLETSRDYLQKHSADFFGEHVKRYADYLKRAKIGLATNTRPSAPKSFLDRQLLSDRALSLYSLKSDAGDTFYFAEENLGKLLKTDSKILIQYVQGVNPLTGTVTEKGQWYPRTEFEEPLTAQKSSQHSFLVEAKQWLQGNSSQWEDTHLNILKILMATPEIDPIYKAKLASQLVWLSRNNDAIELPGLNEWYQKVGKIDLDVAWLDPREDLTFERSKADEILDALPNPAILREALQTSVDSLLADVARRMPVALVLKREDGSLELTTPISELPLGRFEVLLPEGSQWKLETFLELKKDQPPQIHSAAGKIPSGAIVFHIAEPQP